MTDALVVERIQSKYDHLEGGLDERGRRRWAAVEALSLGRGGIAAVATATGISDRTIRNGILELREGDVPPTGRQRRAGGGRKSAQQQEPGLLDALEHLVEPATRGDQSPHQVTATSGSACALRGHEKEGNRRKIQESRTNMATPETTCQSPDPRLSREGRPREDHQSGSLRRVGAPGVAPMSSAVPAQSRRQVGKRAGRNEVPFSIHTGQDARGTWRQTPLDAPGSFRDGLPRWLPNGLRETHRRFEQCRGSEDRSCATRRGFSCHILFGSTSVVQRVLAKAPPRSHPAGFPIFRSKLAFPQSRDPETIRSWTARLRTLNRLAARIEGAGRSARPPSTYRIGPRPPSE
jgi:hypothetical protein